ncbi:MAG: alanine racemase [Bacteroides sp.]|jgi:D-serine deaminase-like pyridoxal phosphate-dependent protein|nr:alanine racemase [Bacteroides sp.]
MQGVTKPTLLVDRQKAKANIGRMLKKTRDQGAILRPHFKTHQSVEVGQWFRESGVDRIAVSSVSMAKQFAKAGWNDILIAFPVNLREMVEINRLAGSVRMGLTLSAHGVMPLFSDLLQAPVDLWLKIDVGTHRTGFDHSDLDAIGHTLEQAGKNPLITLSGLLAHAGHTYHARNSQEILQIQRDSMRILNGLKDYFTDSFPPLQISWGDTPSCSLAKTFFGADELRPGNFVYYDLMQASLGACRPEDIAVAVAAPVVALHPERNEMVIYGGAVHLSKESGKDALGYTHFGLMVILDEDGHWSFPEEPCYVNRISQEHGVIRLPENFLNHFKPGDLVGILPVHSCLTADLLRKETRYI